MARRKLKRPKTSFDVVTLGAATQDVFVQSDHFKNVKDPHAPSGIDACFPMGAKLDLDDVFFDTGGGATNAAATFASFGLNTTCICRVGDDVSAEAVHRSLHALGIDTSHVQIDSKKKTGYSVILLSKEGYRSVLVHRGASSSINQKQITWKKARAPWLYLTSVAGKKPLLQSVFKHAHKSGMHISWNPGGSELKMGYDALTPWILECDFLSLNREEAAELASVTPRHIESIIHRLGPLPKQALIVTDGGKGAYVHSRGTTWFAKTMKGKRVNTTGAGDAFGSAFTAGAIKTGNLEKALAVGMLNAHGVITHMGAKGGILSRFPSAVSMKKVSIKKL